MSPAKLQDIGEDSRKMINGPRPLPLRINRDSHAIQKQSSSQNVPGQESSHAKKQENPNMQQKRQPVIIYTQTPKIIHAQAKDFMALVQKLTGLSRSEDEKSESDKKDNNKSATHEDNEASSVLTEEKYIGFKESSSAVSPMYKMHHLYTADMPLFTPNLNDFFSSSRASMFQSPSMGSSMSPTFLELMKDSQNINPKWFD